MLLIQRVHLTLSMLETSCLFDADLKDLFESHLVIASALEALAGVMLDVLLFLLLVKGILKALAHLHAIHDLSNLDLFAHESFTVDYGLLLSADST